MEDLVELMKAGMVKANPEYQRGEAWKLPQQRKLIDSIMRGYQLPIIYLHYNKVVRAGMTRESYDIIDGQQRITALHRFVEGAFSLYASHDPNAHFPRFLQAKPCPWGEKRFQELSSDLQGQLLKTQIPVAYITDADDNEVRDLFVRLQSGFPLNAQEKRDAYPGHFTEFILALGGKPDILRYPGHEFFKNVLKMKPSQDRGRTRELAARIAMLFLERRREGPEHFVDIGTQAIDNYYYEELDFDLNSTDAKRLESILDKLNQLLGSGTSPKLGIQDGIHLVLLLDSLWDDYTRSWESTFSQAQEKFSASLAEAKRLFREGQDSPAWSQYGALTQANASIIQRRHRYYSEQMHALLGDLTPKDPNRTYGSLEREIIFWRANKKCRVCDAEVTWGEVEIHHVTPHSEGGKTDFENGVLVHKHCHPKTAEAVAALRAKIEAANQKSETE